VADVLEVAQSLKLEVKERDLESCDGLLIRPKGVPRGFIVVNTNIRSEARKRFTIAHEIGHFVLPGHEGAICGQSDIEGWGGKRGERERQADEFAAELLIPSSILGARIASATPSLALIESIAMECSASLSASGWKYCDLTYERCAIVWSTEGKVIWSKPSSEFQFYVRKGKQVEKGTYAYDCFRGEVIPAQVEPVPAHLWLESENLRDGAVIWEESRALLNYGSVLTLLWIRQRIDKYSDYDEIEEEMERSYDPLDFTVYRKRWPS